MRLVLLAWLMIEFLQQELLSLIGDHLHASGLTATAEALQRELAAKSKSSSDSRLRSRASIGEIVPFLDTLFGHSFVSKLAFSFPRRRSVHWGLAKHRLLAK